MINKFILKIKLGRWSRDVHKPRPKPIHSQNFYFYNSNRSNCFPRIGWAKSDLPLRILLAYEGCKSEIKFWVFRSQTGIYDRFYYYYYWEWCKMLETIFCNNFQIKTISLKGGNNVSLRGSSFLSRFRMPSVLFENFLF